MRSWELAIMRRQPLVRPLLDLGCGSGHVMNLLSDSGRLLHGSGMVAGIDISEEFAALAVPVGIYDLVSVADARALPFEPETFETVVSVCVLEHIPRVEAVLENVARVLRPDGRFIFSVPAPPLCEMAAETHGPDGEAFVAQFNARVEHVNVWDAATWQTKLGQAGLECTEVLGFMPPNAARIWFAAYDWTVRPIRGRGALYRLAGPGLSRFGVGAALRAYWMRRLTPAAREGLQCRVEDACALLIAARKP